MPPTPTPAGVIFHLRHGGGPAIREVTGGDKTAFQFIRLEPEDSETYRRVMTMRRRNEPWHAKDKDVGTTELEITRLLRPGDWELWVEVNYQRGAGKAAGINDAWEGVVVSNPVSFKVVELRGEGQTP